MEFYHVSSYATDGQIYLPDNKSLQKYITSFEALNVSTYEYFVTEACNMIPSTVEDETGIRKSKWLCELIFENIRKEKTEWAPRRMHSVFLCASLEEAQLFNKEFRGGTASVFKAIFEGNPHAFDMNVFTRAEEYLHQHMSEIHEPVYEQLRFYALEYWERRRPLEKAEWLYEGRVKLKQLNIE